MMRMAPSTPKPGLMRVSREMGAGVSVVVLLDVAVAFAVEVEEGVKVEVNVVRTTAVFV